jgi:hypothetical protein
MSEEKKFRDWFFHRKGHPESDNASILFQSRVFCGLLRCFFAAGVTSLPWGVRFKNPTWIR